VIAAEALVGYLQSKHKEIRSRHSLVQTQTGRPLSNHAWALASLGFAKKKYCQRLRRCEKKTLAIPMLKQAHDRMQEFS